MHVSSCAQHMLAYIVVIKQSSVVVVINNKCVGIVGVVDVGSHSVCCLIARIRIYVEFYLYWF